MPNRAATDRQLSPASIALTHAHESFEEVASSDAGLHSSQHLESQKSPHGNPHRCSQN
ncbi:hypothetical protein MESS2_1680023 [Mesorhizobium metallidurans STM 2683]|uniref:Uncharacterized protein n=1 Tax=Mesorhizobium metallidurans STM 2683 TaxID=1297569 RepID=M5EM85_9HYPH|nr:hypothetical protein MESS2_1680023 [Mesorhizobium metallidurans STM 2683]